MSIIDFLKKSESLVFWNRCRIHCEKADFRKLVLEGYHSADYLELCHYGDEYKGCIIYDMPETGNYLGFFAELGMTLIKLYFADARGMVPYVHWGDRYVYYEPDGIDGEQNAFLHYFNPVSKITSTDRACYVVHQETWHCEQVKREYQAVSYEVSEEYIDAMAEMVKKYISYNDKMKFYLTYEYEYLLGDKKTLAVHYRGTDFGKGYNNHPVQVQVEQTLSAAKSLVQEKDYKQVFLATDEEKVVEIFREEFGDMLKVYKDTYRDNGSGESVAFSQAERLHHHFLLGREVLRDQYTLIRCNGIVCGYSNVTFLAKVMRRAWYDSDWEDYCLINNGIYHNRNSFSESRGKQG